MKRRQLLLAAAGSTLYQTASAKTSWKLASGYKIDSFQGKNLAEFAKDAEAATGGSLGIELLPNNSFVPMGEIPGAVLDGRLQAGEVIMTGLVKDMPVAGADSVPFVVSSYEDAQRLWKHQRPVLERHFERRGLQVLYAVPWPPQCLYSTKPITKAEDLQGTHMRTYNATTVRIAEMLGAKPVDVPMSEVGRALAEGRMDNMITSATTGVDNKVWDSFKFFYEINAWYPKNLVFVSRKAMDALSPAERKALLEAASRAESRGWETSQVVARESVNELRRHGMKVEPAPALLSPQIRRLGERFSLEWIREIGREANEIFIPFYVKP